MVHKVGEIRMSTDGKMVVRLLGAKIAYFRTLAGLSQDELAVRIHSTQATISKIENGRYNDNLNIKLLFIMFVFNLKGRNKVLLL